jgi:hypothetical protein
MKKLTIELTAKELEATARITGILLGYAVPDRCCDREVIVNIFNVASEKLSDLLITTARNAPFGDDLAKSEQEASA